MEWLFCIQILPEIKTENLRAHILPAQMDFYDITGVNNNDFTIKRQLLVQPMLHTSHASYPLTPVFSRNYG